MKSFKLSKISYALWALLISFETLYAQFDTKTVGPKNLRDVIIFNHFNQQEIQKLQEANELRYGIEVELTGLTNKQVADYYVANFGGKILKVVTEDFATTYYISLPGFPDNAPIRIEEDTTKRILERYKARLAESGKSTFWYDNAIVEALVKAQDKINAAVEIVTPPITYETAQLFSETLNALGTLGGVGSRDFIGVVSTQVNVQIPHNDPIFIKSLLANYYRNAEHIKQELRPTKGRQQYIKQISADFLAKLEDPSWKPTIQELFKEYVAASGKFPKFSKLNVLNALAMNKDNLHEWRKDWESKTAGAKILEPRPVAEFREANTLLGSAHNQARGSAHLMKEIDFATAMILAAHNRKVIELNHELKQASENFSSPKSFYPLIESSSSKPFVNSLNSNYYRRMKVQPVEGNKVLVGNSSLIDEWGYAGNKEEIYQQLLNQFSVNTVPTGDHDLRGQVSESNTAPYATAHEDGYGGVGDGRTLTFLEGKNGTVINAKGTGLTTYIIRPIAAQLGWHLGAVDGKVGLTEGFRSYIIGEILHSLGIPSERVISILSNKGQRDTEFSDVGVDPNAIIVRQIPGSAIRNSHFNTWNKNNDDTQIRKVLDYFKGLASQETGKTMTDATYVAFDTVKTAEVAAKLLDSYIVHGAFTAGNVLAYGSGVVDLNTLEFVEKPDPLYTSLGSHSAFGRTSSRLFWALEKRIESYKRVSDTLESVNVKKIYEDAFRKELTLLTLERLGIQRHIGLRLYESENSLVSNFANKVWSAGSTSLYTDMRKFLLLLSESFVHGNDSNQPTIFSQSYVMSRDNKFNRDWLKPDILNGIFQNSSAKLLTDVRTYLFQFLDGNVVENHETASLAKTIYYSTHNNLEIEKTKNRW